MFMLKTMTILHDVRTAAGWADRYAICRDSDRVWKTYQVLKTNGS